jgi:DNA-binding transcriptional LysR family regulator
MKLTLDALQTLDTIARRGSFSAAAAALGKVPSALTYSVRKLEEDLDVLVFDRRGNRAHLTPAGRELLERGRELLRAAEELTCRVKGVASGWEVELRVAVDTTIAFERLMPLIEDFQRQDAPTSLRLSHEVLDGAIDALVSGRADLALGVPADLPRDTLGGAPITSRPLGDLRLVWCAAPHHPLASAPEPLDAATLLEHRAVAVANSARNLPARSVGLLNGQPLLTVATMEHKLAAQIAGLGVGYLPEPFARPHLRAGRLVARRTSASERLGQLRYAWRSADRGKALAWWLARLEVKRVRDALLAGPKE